MTPSNNITIPNSKILDYQYDTKQRVIIALIGTSNEESKSILRDSIEVHYFHIESCLQWRRKHSV